MANLPFNLGGSSQLGGGSDIPVSSDIFLVNTSPGVDSSGISPLDPINFGLKSTSNTIILGDLNASTGYTNIQFKNLLPELDPVLAFLSGLDVSFDTAEFGRPVTAMASKVIASNSLVITSTTTSQQESGNYVISYSCDETKAPGAYINFKRNTSWITSSPIWTGAGIANVVPIYFSLEYGPRNTSCTVFLVDTGSNGTFVVAGPSATYSSSGTRLGITTFSAKNWKTVANGNSIELWVIFNLASNKVDLWTNFQGDVGPTLLGSISISSLGVFPVEQRNTVCNFRAGPTSSCTMYFGLGGTSTVGQSLTFTDWALYQDLRQSVVNGQGTANNILEALPDAPVVYRAELASPPNKIHPGKWRSTLPISSGPILLPGRRDKPIASTFARDGATEITFFKEEPKVARILDGVVVEAYLSGTVISRDGNSSGMGIGIEDGAKAYYLNMLNDNAGDPTFGVLGNESDPTSLNNYYTVSGNHDYTTLQLVKLVVDRHRQKVDTYVGNMDVPSNSTSMSATFPPSPTPNAFIKFGHFGGVNTTGNLNVSFLNYLPRYKAWEGKDFAGPDDSGVQNAVRFIKNDSGTGNSIVVNPNGISIKKSSFNLPTSKLSFSRSETLSVQSGIQIDFRSMIYSYQDLNGTTFASNINIGVGLILYLSGKILNITFYDCGIYGRKIGVLPGTGSELDIVQQTILGKKFSAPVDWTQMNSFRVVMKARDSIKIWTKGILNDPDIIIPWRDDTNGFDLPSDVSLPGIEFGHLSANTSSITNWEFVRWGISNGYEIAITHQYPNGTDPSVFSGRILELLTVSDQG